MAAFVNLLRQFPILNTPPPRGILSLLQAGWHLISCHRWPDLLKRCTHRDLNKMDDIFCRWHFLINFLERKCWYLDSNVTEGPINNKWALVYVTILCWAGNKLLPELMMIQYWSGWAELTHWGQVTHICVSNLIIGSDNGLPPGRRQAIIWTNAGILLIGPLGTNFSEISIGIQTFSFKKLHLKTSSAKWRLFCLGLNELTHLTCNHTYEIWNQGPISI